MGNVIYKFVIKGLGQMGVTIDLLATSVVVHGSISLIMV